MGKRLVAFTCTILMALSAQAAFAEKSDPSIRTVLPEAAVSRILPLDSVIGQVVDPTASADHAILYEALRSEYSVSWVERYMASDMRAILVRMFDAWLSENLPAKTVLLSAAHHNPDGSVGIDVRCNLSCMSFLLKDGRILAMRSLD